jgi:hypothetical protein
MKKKGKKKKAGQVLTPETVEKVERLLEDLKTQEAEGKRLEASLQSVQSQMGMSIDQDVALIDAIGGVPTERMARLLHSLLDRRPDKKIVKAIKRSLYRMEQKGVPVEPAEGEDQTDSILRPPVQEESRGFISAVDSEGGQVVFLAIPRKPTGLYLIQGIVNDTRGLVDFNRVETTKRGFREFYQSITNSGQLPIVEVEPGYCRFRLDEAALLNEDHGQSPPPAYTSSKKDLQKIEQQETPPIRAHLTEEEIQADPRHLKNASDLFEVEPFSSWLLPKEEIQEYADLIDEAGESRLVLNPAQKETRLQEVYRKALADLFPEERRVLYRHRLEEMAYVLLKEGKEERAKAAFSAGINLKAELTSLDPNPFLLTLVTRSIYTLLARSREEKKEDPSLLVKP